MAVAVAGHGDQGRKIETGKGSGRMAAAKLPRGIGDLAQRESSNSQKDNLAERPKWVNN